MAVNENESAFEVEDVAGDVLAFGQPTQASGSEVLADDVSCEALDPHAVAQSLATIPHAYPAMRAIANGRNKEGMYEYVHPAQFVLFFDISGLSPWSQIANLYESREGSEFFGEMFREHFARKYGEGMIDFINGDDGKYGISVNASPKIAAMILDAVQYGIEVPMKPERIDQLKKRFPGAAHKFVDGKMKLKVVLDYVEKGEMTSTVVDKGGIASVRLGGEGVDRLGKLEKKAKVGEPVITDKAQRMLGDSLENLAAQYDPATAQVRAQVVRDVSKATLDEGRLSMKHGDWKIPEDMDWALLGRTLGVPLENRDGQLYISDEVAARLEDENLILINPCVLVITFDDGMNSDEVNKATDECYRLMGQQGLRPNKNPKIDNRMMILEFIGNPAELRRKSEQVFNGLRISNPNVSFVWSKAESLVPVRISGDFSLERDRAGAAMAKSPVISKMLSRPGVFVMDGPFAAMALDRPVEWTPLSTGKKGIPLSVVLAEPAEGVDLNDSHYQSRELVGVDYLNQQLEAYLADDSIRFISMTHESGDPAREELRQNARFGKSAFGREFARQHPDQAKVIRELDSNSRYPVAQRVMELLCERAGLSPYGSVEEALSNVGRFNVAGPLLIVIDASIGSEDMEQLQQLAHRTPACVKFLFSDGREVDVDERLEFKEKTYDEFLNIFLQKAVNLPTGERVQLAAKFKQGFGAPKFQALLSQYACTPPMADRFFDSVMVEVDGERMPLGRVSSLPAGHAWRLIFDTNDLDVNVNEYIAAIDQRFPDGHPGRNLVYVLSRFKSGLYPEELAGIVGDLFPELDSVQLQDVLMARNAGLLSTEANSGEERFVLMNRLSPARLDVVCPSSDPMRGGIDALIGFLSDNPFGVSAETVFEHLAEVTPDLDHGELTQRAQTLGVVDRVLVERFVLAKEASRPVVASHLVRVDDSFDLGLSNWMSNHLVKNGMDVTEGKSALRAEAILESGLHPGTILSTEHVKLIRSLFDYYRNGGQHRALYNYSITLVKALGFNPAGVAALPDDLRLDIAEVIYLYSKPEALKEGELLGNAVRGFVNDGSDRSKFLKDGMACVVSGGQDMSYDQRVRQMMGVSDELNNVEMRKVLEAAILLQGATNMKVLKGDDKSSFARTFDERLSLMLDYLSIFDLSRLSATMYSQSEYVRMAWRRLADAILEAQTDLSKTNRELAKNIHIALDTFYQDAQLTTPDSVYAAIGLLKAERVDLVKEDINPFNEIFSAFKGGSELHLSENNPVDPLKYEKLLQMGDRALDLSLQLPSGNNRFHTLVEYANAYLACVILAWMGAPNMQRLVLDNFDNYSRVHTELPNGYLLHAEIMREISMYQETERQSVSAAK